MHYIRFLKLPRLLSTPSPVLSAKITVTTDLGESFLFTDLTLVVELESQSGAKILGPRNGKEYLWKGSDGMRSLEVSFPVPSSKKSEAMRMLIRPKENKHNVKHFNNMLVGTKVTTENDGRVVAVRSMDIDVSKAGLKGISGMARRVFFSNEKIISICEETGESIARHIWDAGLMLSSYLAITSPINTSPDLGHALPQLPVLKHKLSLSNLNVLELGTGCGIVGITLSIFYPNATQILLTDLPEASEIITHNLSLLSSSRGASVTHEVLDWSSPLPPRVGNINWDIVLVADCTYNPDVVPDLVSTLRSVARGGKKDVLVLLAMKIRHEDEMVCFDLLEQSGFMVKEKAVLPLLMLAGEPEQIEIFVSR
ncbi:hypothetical protein OIDMADRAFT_41331 [Oidiodendron maius Zn]|uniref:Uncharacterized protein n=1 Tax=Oidiodendron maius (strain Zn) TaxID=913774 RepID=A0A0C3HGD1_OIDMZ|nr:hypothetical protein OIDMADRAFT_41331 [Oidiodendron maius Zn]